MKVWAKLDFLGRLIHQDVEGIASGHFSRMADFERHVKEESDAMAEANRYLRELERR